mgnify:FL=1
MNLYNFKWINGVKTMSIMNDLKKILLDVNVNLTELAEALSKRLNKPYSMQNLSNKLRNETITHREMILIADILGYDLKFERKNS